MKVSEDPLCHHYHLISICAWCKEPSKQATLKKNEVYTHGICVKHRQKLIQKALTNKNSSGSQL